MTIRSLQTWRISSRLTVLFAMHACLADVHLAGLAVPASVVTAATGWILAESTSGDLELHRWLGVATAVLTAATAVAVRRANEERSGPWRLLLIVTLFLMLSAAHGGGELVHGEDWLRMPLAWMIGAMVFTITFSLRRH